MRASLLLAHTHRDARIGALRLFVTLALVTSTGCATGGTRVVQIAAPPAVQIAAPPQAAAHDIDEGYFYANLAPHGDWFFQADFGWVWHPSRVGSGWRPYTEGQWVWAEDAGWTWASQEPWGWATYHYGRWYFDPMFGWSWVPGRTWAPAWVSWRVEAGYIGWAPLWPAYFDEHPEYRWESWRHDADWDRRHHGRDWDRWVFTRDRDFTSERVGRVAVRDRAQRNGIYSRSHDVTRFDEANPERIGHSIDRAVVEKATGRPVRSVRLEAAEQPGQRDDARGDSVRMFRPRVNVAPPEKTPDRLGYARTPASRESREQDTLRTEKRRLNGRAEKDAAAGKAAPVSDRSRPKQESAQPGSPERAPTGNAQRENAKRENAQRHDVQRKNEQRENSQGEPARTERTHAEKGRTEPARGESSHTKPVRTERAPTESGQPANVQPPNAQRENVQPPNVQPGKGRPEHPQDDSRAERVRDKELQRMQKGSPDPDAVEAPPAQPVSPEAQP